VRIGDLIYQSEPGEPFPEIRLSLAKDVHGASAIVALSKGQDDLAYFYPAEDYPATFAYGSDHWEYNVAPQAGDELIQAGRGGPLELRRRYERRTRTPTVRGTPTRSLTTPSPHPAPTP
jgi:hypothetical protein